MRFLLRGTANSGRLRPYRSQVGSSCRFHHTHSKVLCWVAFDRLIKMHEAGHLKVPVAMFRLRGERTEGGKFPKTAKPLEVARFVRERARLEGYREPPPWKAWFERWNEEHPGHSFESYSHFRTYFFRGDAAVKQLNFASPKVRSGNPEPTDRLL